MNVKTRCGMLLALWALAATAPAFANPAPAGSDPAPGREMAQQAVKGAKRWSRPTTPSTRP